LRALDALVDRLWAVAGAVGLSQVPGYLSHYQQRLGGHLAEARRNVEAWREVVAKTGAETLDGLIARYLESGMKEAIEAGRKCAADVARLEELQRAVEAIRDAPVWSRFFVFMQNMEPDIARSALSSYKPNVPLDPESLAYALIGLLLALGLYYLLKKLGHTGLRAAARRLKRTPRQA
jgi:hypothetical protein